MTLHNQLGKTAEELASAYLLKNNFKILHRNWRYSHFEIDIIATKDNFLHFVEVKSRSNPTENRPEEAVTKKKFKFLSQAAEEFLHQNQQYHQVCFDIMAIHFIQGKSPEYLLIEDVFL
ncbi:MAG: hypothetical protein EPO57_01140 [Chitinophagaceae bacterium]|nr:MAG: hypothetical protein EPO57_01140 [Chitinophagaceae bacterium]